MNACGKPPVVYVVDDDDALRDSLRWLLESAGYKVSAHSTAERFLLAYRPGMAGCLVLDVRMPGASGLELQQELMRRAATLPIIFVTGHGTVSAGIRAMKGGAVDFLEKPVDEKELLGGIRQALRKSREARAALTERVELEQRLGTLTVREREVLDLVVTGILNKQIGERLGVAEKTIKVHRGRVMQKMAAASVADLVRMLHKLGLETSTPLPDGRGTKGQ